MMNLHVYSQYSGKDYLPPEKQLLSEFKSGKTILSVTDHNCVKANPIALLLSKEYRASIERLCETQAMGFHITEKDMWNIAKNQYHPGNWTGKMFTEVLFSKLEYFNYPILQNYQLEFGSFAERYEAFHHDFYGEGALCYVKTDYMHISEAIRIIHRNGGKAVLRLSESCRIDTDDIPELFDYNLDFIDFYNNYFMNCRENVLFGSLSHHLTQELQYI